MGVTQRTLPKQRDVKCSRGGWGHGTGVPPQLLTTARPCTPLHCPHRSRGDGPANTHSWRGLRERGLRENSATWGSFTLVTNKMPAPPPHHLTCPSTVTNCYDRLAGACTASEVHPLRSCQAKGKPSATWQGDKTRNKWHRPHPLHTLITRGQEAWWTPYLWFLP